MPQTVKQQNGETIFTLHNDEGVTVGEMFDLLKAMMEKTPSIKDSPLSLCLANVATSDSLITKVENEGDNFVVWVFVSDEFESHLKVI